jgi:hypothetical protein
MYRTSKPGAILPDLPYLPDLPARAEHGQQAAPRSDGPGASRPKRRKSG